MRRAPGSGRGRTAIAVVATFAVLAPLGWMWWSSLLPDSYDMAAMGYADHGGGPRTDHDHGHGHGTPVAELVGDTDGAPDVAVTLRVRREGSNVLVNGTSPGPEIRATLGDLIEVTLVNENLQEGTTLHWHGLDVPNAMDGVAGVTQDAVAQGARFVYRFVADQAGTFWYHSHQVSHQQVRRGLLGALVIEPPDRDPGVHDQVVVLHRYGEPTLNGRAGTTVLDVEPGRRVRLRVVNTDNGLATAWVTGAPFRLLAVDGVDLARPGPVEGRSVGVPAGGRVDLGLEVPAGGARVDFSGTTALVLGSDPGGASAQPPDELDLLGYGEPAQIGFDPAAADRRFEYRIGRRPGFLDGRPGLWWTVNGRMFPDVPMFMVEEGDVVVFRIWNDSGDTHPMHLHGHHAVVLSRDGRPATGSPWWVDSLEVRVGEKYEIAFVADNPGLWMDHCHNLQHAVEGLVAHLMYAGVSSSFRIGGEAGNEPE